MRADPSLPSTYGFDGFTQAQHRRRVLPWTIAQLRDGLKDSVERFS